MRVSYVLRCVEQTGNHSGESLPPHFTRSHVEGRSDPAGACNKFFPGLGYLDLRDFYHTGTTLSSSGSYRYLFKIPNVRVVDPVLARRKSDAHGSHHNTVPDFNVSEIWIADQMRELMKRKPLSKIRITEICRAAEIERSTFYYHFKDKYDLIAWISSVTRQRTRM